MVLHVDDDIDDIELVQDAFERNHYLGQITSARDGKVLMENLQESASKKPQVILLDLNMPLKNGFQVLEEIKQHPVLKSINVVVLTASTSKDDEARCYQLGCDSFLRKPTTMNEYNHIVNVVLSFIKSEE
jgi:CheY-like chemotaxis protein